jgi:hypothetical protein
MSKHLYCCQNTLQNFHDHIINTTELTDIIKSIYADMIQNPANYGLPLIEDIEYTPFNPKAADSKNSANRLIALLHTLINSSELADGELIVDDKKFSDSLKKLKSKHKVANSKMIFQKLRDFGFIYDKHTFSYPDSPNVITDLYEYMKNVSINHEATFSLNCYDETSHPNFIAQYLSGNEREFFTQLNSFMDNQGFIVGNSPDFSKFSYSLEYLIDAKDEKRIIRCYTDYGKLRMCLKLHSSDCYDYYTENLPEQIKSMFRKESGCKRCKESCTYRLYRTFEGISYTDCGYGNWFTIIDYDPNDLEYYKQIISLETKAVKTNARRKGVKVYL